MGIEDCYLFTYRFVSEKTENQLLLVNAGEMVTMGLAVK
jgi:hypothetical protein